MAGVPTSSVSAVAPMPRRLHIEEQAEQRRGDDQRQHARRPVREAFHQHGQRQHVAVAGKDQKVERAVLAVGLEQPVEAEQARRAARRSTGSPGRCATSRLRSGPTANGMVAITARKNSTPVSAPPPARMPRLHIAEEEGEHLGLSLFAMWSGTKSGHARFPQLQHRRPLDPERQVRRGNNDAAAGEMRRHQRRESASRTPLSSPAVGSSSSQTGRRLTSSLAIAARRRWPVER